MQWRNETITQGIKGVISGSLEYRLSSKGKQLSSTLAHSTKRKRESLLEKSFIIDVKVQDIVPISEILRTMDQLRWGNETPTVRGLAAENNNKV